MGVGRYLARRALFLAITFVIAIYVTVVIANGFGKVDEILKAQIYQDLKQAYARNPAYNRLPPEEQARQFNITYNATIEAQGLNEQFLPKTIRYTASALQLKLGRATQLRSGDGSASASAIIFDSLPTTPLLFTAPPLTPALVAICPGLPTPRNA